MRYRIGSEPGESISDDMLVVTAVFGLVMGIGFVVTGLQARQNWLIFWGGGLVVASVVYIVAVVLGYG